MSDEQESTTDSADQWASTLIAKARDSNPLPNEDVLKRMEQLLEGPISERTLTQTNLKSVATQLLLDMAPKLPDADGAQ